MQDHDDIALIKLDRDLGIEPIQVDGWQSILTLPAGTEVVLAGFGVLQSQDVEGSPRLMRVTVPLASKDECTAANPSAAAEGTLHFEHVLCTGGVAGKDSCRGDSGGPAVVEQDGRQWLVGVLSLGSELPLTPSGCAVEGRYGVYTNVRWYTDWMVAVVTEQPYDAGDSCPAVGVYNASHSRPHIPSLGERRSPTNLLPLSGLALAAALNLVFGRQS